MIDVRKVKSKRSNEENLRAWLENREMAIEVGCRTAFARQDLAADPERTERMMRLKLWNEIYGDLWKPLVQAQARLASIEHAYGTSFAGGRTGLGDALAEVQGLMESMRASLMMPGDDQP